MHDLRRVAAERATNTWPCLPGDGGRWILSALDSRYVSFLARESATIHNATNLLRTKKPRRRAPPSWARLFRRLCLQVPPVMAAGGSWQGHHAIAPLPSLLFSRFFYASDFFLSSVRRPPQ